MTATARQWLPRLLPVALLALAGWVLWREFSGLDPGHVKDEILAWGPWRLAAAAGLSAMSYALLAGMEWAGLRWSGAKVPFGATLLGSFCANAFAHTIGFAVLIGTAVRARLYTRHGASLVQVAQTSVFCAVSFGLGIAALGGVALLISPHLGANDVRLHPPVVRLIALLLLAIPVLYVAACAFLRGELRIAGRVFSLPPPGIALAQIALGLVDNIVTAGVVWVLLPDASIGYAAFSGAYVVATLVGVISSVPGGAGVFEGTVLTLLPDLSRPSLAAAFLGYRLIYYLIPLLLAAALLIRAGLVSDVRVGAAVRVWRVIAPPALAVAAFTLGAVLILTGIGRIDPDRLAILKATVPLLLLETSQMISLVSGLTLMGASLGLLRRRSRAVPVAAAAAFVGASTALLRGLDVGPAILAALLAGLILWSREAFQRKAALRSDGLISWWLTGMAAVLVGAVGLGLWVYADTPYEARLWGHIGYHADFARFLRSIAFLGSAFLVIGVWVLARAGAPPAAPADAHELLEIRPLVEASPDTTARLALLGDKALLRSEPGDAFIMYGAEGRSLIAMGDPVGDRTGGRVLLWRLKEQADAADARLVVYHASPGWLTEYLDLGLSLLKLGDEARVRLPDFSLTGGARRNLRQGHAKAVRDGLSFELVAPPQSDALLADLQAISDSWLIDHGGREKGFSLGRFDPDVLRHDPIALVRRDGRIVAFANVWTGGGVEASIDLMRHDAEASHGVMDFLFVELLEWAKRAGFEWFNLGLAPLTGLAEHPLAPLWHKIGAQVARRGGRYYGFLGLRAFKEKFDPVWTPRYLAASPMALASAIVDVTRLIARPPGAKAHDVTKQLSTEIDD